MRGGVNNRSPLLDSSVSQSYLEALEEVKKPHEVVGVRTIAPENRSSSTILAAPKVNSCSVVLIKNRTSGDYFLLHHTPQDLDGEKLYKTLFESLNQGDEIDVVVAAGGLKQELFLKGCQSKDIKINSSRSVPSKVFFNLEAFVFWGEPKSLHVTYDPADDRLMIFGDESSRDGKPSCYSAEAIFEEPEKQILMRRVSEISNFPNALDSGNGWSHFASRLPLTDKSFVNKVSQRRADSAIEYVDENAASAAVEIFRSLSEGDQDRAMEIDQNSDRIIFVLNLALKSFPDLKDHLKYLLSPPMASKELDLQMSESITRPSSANNKFRDKVLKTREEGKSPERVVAEPFVEKVIKESLENHIRSTEGR